MLTIEVDQPGRVLSLIGNITLSEELVSSYVTLAHIAETYQPLNAELTAIAGLTSAANKLPYFTDTDIAALTNLTPFARTILDDADAATVRATIGAGTGTGDVVGPSSAVNNRIARFDGPTGKLIQQSSARINDDGTVVTPGEVIAVGPVTGRSLRIKSSSPSTAHHLVLATSEAITAERTLTLIVGDANRTLTLGGNATLNGGTHSGTNTGDQDLSSYATTAAVAAGYQPLHANLTTIAGLTSAANKLAYFTGSGTAALTDLSAFARTILDDADAAAVRSTIGAAAASGAGDVVGPGSATDNAIARYDGTTGKLLQDSLAAINDIGHLTAPDISAFGSGNYGNVFCRGLSLTDPANSTPNYVIAITRAGSQTGHHGLEIDVNDGDRAISLAGDLTVPATITLGTGAALTKDTDGTFAADSDDRVATQKAVKSYVDNLVTGLSWKTAVRAATTVAGTLASDFENGDTIDGVTLATGNRILIKNQADAKENGIYVVAASGAPARASDANTGTELVNATVLVSEGTTNADTQWTCSTNATITIGSTNITFAQVAGAGVYTNGTGITLSGNVFSIDTSWVGQVAITTVGTITTGTWNASVVGGQYGGTGVNNSGKTITLGGNLTTSGANAVTLTTSGATNVTLPTTGTLATLAGTETLTSKTLTSPVLTTPQINDTSADHQYVVAVSELTADRTVTLPLLTGDDTFVFAGHAQTLTNKTLTEPLSTQKVTASTAGSGSPNTITAAQSGTCFDNAGATAENYHTLPDAVVGLWYDFSCVDADGIRATAKTGETIRYATTVSATAGYIRSNVIGSTLRLRCVETGKWEACRVVGHWAIDATGDTTNDGSAGLGSVYNFPGGTGNASAVEPGISVTLPGAGKWELSFALNAVINFSAGSNGRLFGYLYNVTGSAVVSDSTSELVFWPTTGATNADLRPCVVPPITVSGATTIRVEVYSSGGTTWTTRAIDTPGTRLKFRRVQ